MKKLLAVCLSALLCLSLMACAATPAPGGQQNAADLPEVAMTLGDKNVIADYASFTLFKISNGKKATATIGGGLYYENDNAGETYVDVILDWTNLSANAVSSEDIMSITATNAAGAKFGGFTAVETNNSTYLTRYEKLSALSTTRVHAVISVPETETVLTVHLVIQGTDYTYTYTMGQPVSNATAITEGDVLEDTNYAALSFKGAAYTDDLLPTDTSGVYSHYEIDDPANTYLVVKFDITNYMSDAKDCETFAGVTAVYLDKYTYTGSLVVEDEDGNGFSRYENVSPLGTRHCFYMIEVPKTVIENPVKLTIAFNSQEYTYTYAP